MGIMAGINSNPGKDINGAHKYFEWLDEDLLLIRIVATTPREAVEQRDCILAAIAEHSHPGRQTTLTGNQTQDRPVVIAEDRMRRHPEQYEARIAAHRKNFRSVFARNCEVHRIDSSTCAQFMDANHSYGKAKSRYHYGIFFKGSLVGAAQFSSARCWTKGDRKIRSFEWVRYASLPDTRIVGGMGKILNTFIEETHPDDIMSYADLEWSDGKVYETLGFVPEGVTPGVLFAVNKETWTRTPIKTPVQNDAPYSHYFLNFGSRKYRLKLTEY